MPRNNRFTIKSRRRNQRSKILHAYSGEQVRIRTWNPKSDERERGDAPTWLILLVGFLLILVAVFAGSFFQPADARAVRIEGPYTDTCYRNPVVYLEHVQRRWYYAELCSGATWMVTPCRYEDGNNCLWRGWRDGNGDGRSFVMLRGHKHRVIESALP